MTAETTAEETIEIIEDGEKINKKPNVVTNNDF
jgi:hypothetical protein